MNADISVEARRKNWKKSSFFNNQQELELEEPDESDDDFEDRANNSTIHSNESDNDFQDLTPVVLKSRQTPIINQAIYINALGLFREKYLPQL